MAVRMVRVKGNGLIVKGSVSDDVIERIGSESGSYVIMTSRGKVEQDIKGTRLSMRQYS